MSSLINKWTKAKKSGAFHRKWKKNIKKTDILAIAPEVLIDDCESNNIPSNEFTTNNAEGPEMDNIKENWLIEMSNSNEEISDEDDGESELVKNNRFRIELRKWANTFNIKHNALKVLLKTINNRLPSILPKDPRTFLSTPEKISTFRKIGYGQYWHQGLKMCLEKVFSYLNAPNHISININIDGLPLHRSSKDEFWPLLFNIYQMPELQPMIIGIYWGKGKPSNLSEYLAQFVEEMNEIYREGITVDNQLRTVKIRSFICDSPARAFIKGKSDNNRFAAI